MMPGVTSVPPAPDFLQPAARYNTNLTAGTLTELYHLLDDRIVALALAGSNRLAALEHMRSELVDQLHRAGVPEPNTRRPT